MGLALYQEVFQTEVGFNQTFCDLQFDNAVLDLALPQADAQLAALARRSSAGPGSSRGRGASAVGGYEICYN